VKVSSFNRRRERGAVAVVVIVTMLAVLMIYSAANVRTLVHLQGELKLLEQRQVQRLAKDGGARGPEARAPGVLEKPGTETER
jgi:hypothetical protein